MVEQSRYLRRQEAAWYVESKYGTPCAYRTLAKLASVGGGPIFRKAGRIPLYATDDLDAWAEARIGPPCRSTSEPVEVRDDR